MCSVCRQAPCDFRCPDATETKDKVIGTCFSCGTSIFEGNEHAKMDDLIFCSDCLKRSLKYMAEYIDELEIKN